MPFPFSRSKKAAVADDAAHHPDAYGRDVYPEGPGNLEKGSYDDSPYPLITLRAAAMGFLVSMGGIVFGFDTGQISGFQEMPDFLRRFGDKKNPPGFGNVRSGLIVGLLSIGTLIGARELPVSSFSRDPLLTAFSHRCIPCGSNRSKIRLHRVVGHFHDWSYHPGCFLHQLDTIHDGQMGGWSGSRWPFSYGSDVPE